MKPLIRIWFVVVLAGLGSTAAGDSRPMTATTPLGLWWAERGAARVEIDRCGEALCGRIVWLRSPFDEHGCPLRDDHNPAPSLRRRELLGVEILRGFRASPDDGAWIDGEIYDPGSGRTYRATLREAGPDRLELRGYVGIPLLGRSVTWIRVGAEPLCREGAT